MKYDDEKVKEITEECGSTKNAKMTLKSYGRRNMIVNVKNEEGNLEHTKEVILETINTHRFYKKTVP